MLNSGKKKYSSSCVVRKQISGRNKNQNPPPPFKLNGLSLIDHEMNHENGGNSLWLIHIIIYLNKALF